MLQPFDFSHLFGHLRGISDRALAAHLELYRQAVARLNAIDAAYPMVEWKPPGAPVARDAIMEALLRTPVAQLDLQPYGPLAECLQTVEDELAAKGIAFLPAWYLGVADDDFWTVDRAISVNIPWCFANQSLWRLASRSAFTAYTPEEMLRTLRHEAGHALCYAFELWRQPGWQAVFGDSRAPYRDGYTPDPRSREHVEYLQGARAHYAQKHPDEDWAEAFACWLDPASNWREQYADWPGALRKLEYLEELARAGQFAGEPPNRYLGHQDGYRQTRGTVAQALQLGTAVPAGSDDHAGLLVAEPEAYNAVVLHEAFFACQGRFCSPAIEGPPDVLKAAALANWGSWESFLLDLRLCCQASAGWALVVWDERRRQMRLAAVQPGGPVPAECRVVLALDLADHATALDYGLGKHLGIAAQMENVDWQAVAARLASPWEEAKARLGIAVVETMPATIVWPVMVNLGDGTKP